MNRHFREDALPLALGARIEPVKAAPVTIVPVAGRDHLFLDKETGRMAYLPPPPPARAPVVKRVARPPSVVIDDLHVPERAEDDPWKSGFPPAPGWYMASTQKSLTATRYFNGLYWSHSASEGASARAILLIKEKCALTNQAIEWRWAISKNPFIAELQRAERSAV